MAASITTSSTTLEGQILEVLMAAQAAERDTARNADNRNFITGSYNSDTGTYTGTYSLPAAQTIGAGGVLQIAATSYLTD